MSVLHSSCETQVHVVFDDSGSMYYSPGANHRSASFIQLARKEFDLMADRMESPRLSFTFHLFSDTAYTGRRLGDMPSLSAGTNIALGFETMTKSVLKSQCEHSVIIFVSDGADERGNEARRARLTPLPCKSTLLTVAVGNGFPTSLVVNELRAKYHTFGGDSIPLVFPLSNEVGPDLQQNIRWVVSELEEIINMGGVQPEISMEELSTSLEIDVIFGQCKRWYNACTIKCMLKSGSDPILSRQSDVDSNTDPNTGSNPRLSLLEKIDLVKETKDKFDQAGEMMKRITVAMAKPLMSNLKSRRPIFLLTTLREKLNTMLEQLNKGRLFEELTDVEKQEYLSFGNVAGRFLTTSIKYNAANFETTKTSLVRYVKNYEPTVEDENLIDQINICTWAEYMEDAKKNVHLFNDMRTLAGVLEGVPFMGRPVELYDIPDCAQINPWVDSIKNLPMTIKTITTHDLYIQYNGCMGIREEKTNAIIILGGVPSCPGIFCHLQSFALTKNWLLYFNDARLAAASMLLVYVTSNNEPGEWKLEELSRVRSICDLHTPINSRWWHDYLDCLKTDEFSNCLVTESPKLSKFMTCPGMGKFILGMWLLADQGFAFTEKSLLDRFQATAVEHIGRCKLTAENFFTVERVTKRPDSSPVTEALDAVIPNLKASYLSIRKISSLLQTALQVHIKKVNTDARGDTTISFRPSDLMKMTHFNVSLEQVHFFFAGLFDKCGIKWDGPTDEVLMRALMIATSHGTSFDRNHPTCFVDATQEEILANMAGKMAGKGCGDTRANIMLEAKKGVTSYFNRRHLGLPRPIPNELVLRYQKETGRDIAETWQLDEETCLSPIACCFPSCDLYLVIPPGDDKKRREVVRDHIRTCCKNSIPGLHRCVVRNLHLHSADIIPLIESGVELGEPFLPREVTRRLAKGVGVYGGVPRSFASAEKYKEHAMEIERKAMHRKIKAAIKEFTGGDQVVLYHAIDDIKISLDAKMWSYSAFKRTFDSKYEALRS